MMSGGVAREDPTQLTRFAAHEADIKSSQSLFARLFQRDKGIMCYYLSRCFFVRLLYVASRGVVCKLSIENLPNLSTDQCMSSRKISHVQIRCWRNL